MEWRSHFFWETLFEKIIKMFNRLRCDIQQSNREEKSPWEGHRQIHDCFVMKASKVRYEISEDRDFEEEGHHESDFHSQNASHSLEFFDSKLNNDGKMI